MYVQLTRQLSNKIEYGVRTAESDKGLWKQAIDEIYVE
jgi:hypothetical protein